MAAVAIETKITSPIVWDAQQKFKIQDLQERDHDEAMKLIRRRYFDEDPMCRSLEITKDPESLDEFSHSIKTWMNDSTSLVAVSQKSGRIVGLAVTRTNSVAECSSTYSRVQLLQGDRLRRIVDFKNALIKRANLYESLNHESYLRVYLLYVHPSYGSKGVGIALLNACCFVALHMKVPVVAGIFASGADQLLADNAGFATLAEIEYKNYAVGEKVVFDNPGYGNYSAAFMYCVVPDEQTLIRKRQEYAEENSQGGA